MDQTQKSYIQTEAKPRPKYASHTPEPLIKLLENKKTHLPALVRVADNVLGTGWRVFEPDTIRLDLAEVTTEIPGVNIDKLLAAQTLFKRDFMFWDANTFENTCMPFNHRPAKPEALQYPPVAYLCWFIEGLKVLFNDKMLKLDEDLSLTQMFDYEPSTYVAVLCASKGWVLLPEQLQFASTPFDKMIRQKGEKNINLRERVKAQLSQTSEKDIKRMKTLDDPVWIRVAKHLAAKKYVRDESERLNEQLQTIQAVVSGDAN